MTVFPGSLESGLGAGLAGGKMAERSPDILPVNQAEEAECHHVPVGAIVVPHQVQGQRHV